MKKTKNTFWISTVLLSLMTIFSAAMYIFNYPLVFEAFTTLRYPTYLIYPLAIAKLAGIFAILFITNRDLKRLAYTGLFYTAILGTLAHIQVGDGQFGGALVFLLLIVVSFITGRKLKRV